VKVIERITPEIGGSKLRGQTSPPKLAASKPTLAQIWLR